MKNLLTMSIVTAAMVLPAHNALATSPHARWLNYGSQPGGHVKVTNEDHHDTSPPLRDLAGRPSPPGPHHADDIGRLPRPTSSTPTQGHIQTSLGSTLAPVTTQNFAGIGQGFSGPAGTFTVNSAPPDTNGDVGPNHYVQVVNSDFAVWSKTGTVLYGPVALNTLWQGFGGSCQTNNDGDPVVKYDRAADRWIISQFSVTGANGTTVPFLQCVAVSQTPDPTGAYYRYAFPYAGFNDYPKMGVWPDGYYLTFNMFNAAGTAFTGAKMCAYDRTRMLTGAAATQQCFDTSTTYGGLLPSDAAGTTPPPTGSPAYIMGLGATSSSLALWRFHVDWTTPANSAVTGPLAVSVPAYTMACGSSGTCIPQSGTTQQLDSLSDRLMYQLQYRNFGDHEALVTNHSVTVAGGQTGIRWYEIRNPGGTPTVFQQGTYAPDAAHRWMGSIAMDHVGNMALGFSVSSASMHPAIRYTGRLVGDTAGQMTQGEGSLIEGGGSQTTTLSRWGDYSSMSVDPTDDCTFWYTQEYLASSGTFNWRTRIGSFRFPTCGTPPTIVSADHTTATVGLTVAFNVAAIGDPTPSLAVSGALPGGMTFTDNHNGTGSLSGTPAANTAGTYNLTLTAHNGVGADATQPFTLTVATPDASTTITLTTGAGWNMVGGSPLTLWSDATTTWAFAASTPAWYHPTGTEPAGTGAWEAVSTAGSRTVTVQICSGAVSIPVVPHRWNLVGNPCNLPVSLPGTARAEWWDPTATHYLPVSSIGPGAAAWVKPEDSTLTLTPGTSTMMVRTMASRPGAARLGTPAHTGTPARDLPPRPTPLSIRPSLPPRGGAPQQHSLPLVRHS